MKNLFIVFEGIDGSGTSTQVLLLKQYFNDRNNKAVETSEPSNGPIGHLIREGMKKRIIFTANSKLFDEQMAYLFAADRHDHLYNDIDGVIKLLQDYTVISTRYYFSSLAYHCDNMEEFNFVKKLNEKFPDPDLVVYIDNPLELSLERLGLRSTRDIYENREKLIKVKQNYNYIFSNYNNTKIRVDGSDTIDNIHNQIIDYIKENFDV